MRAHDLIVDVDFDLPVWKVVNTSEGPVTAIVDFDQYASLQKKSYHLRFEMRDGCFHCRECGAAARQAWVYHYYARLKEDGAGVVVDPDYGKIHTTAYCPECGDFPDPMGNPILEKDSVYNKPS